MKKEMAFIISLCLTAALFIQCIPSAAAKPKTTLQQNKITVEKIRKGGNHRVKSRQGENNGKGKEKGEDKKNRRHNRYMPRPPE